MNCAWRFVYKSREQETLQEIGFSTFELLQFKERILDIEKEVCDILVEGIEHRGPLKISVGDRTRRISV